MAQLSPYIGFGGKAEDAMKFYQSIFGGDLQIQTIKDSPMAGQFKPEMQDKVLHSYLGSNKIVIMASDMSSEEGFNVGNNISLCLQCESKEEIESLYAKLSDGGNARHPLKEEFFGTFGDLKDRFGINWMLQYSSPQQQ